MVEQLKKIFDQQTIIIGNQLQNVVGNQLQHVVGLLERKTIEKDGSRASVGEFNNFFSFSPFRADAWVTTTPNEAFRKSASELIRSHQSAMKIKRDEGLVNEVMHVQGDSKDLLQQLMDLYFVDERVELIPERPYSCTVTNRDNESVKYRGKTDAVIKSTECDIAVLCWEIKSQLIDLRGGGEIAQTAAEMSGELEAMLKRFNIKPRRYAAVLTNGVGFLFVMATLVEGFYSWRHSPLVTKADSAAAMIEGCFAVAAEVLQLLTESFDLPFERLQLEDADGDDGGGRNHTNSDGADRGTKSVSLGASLSGFGRVLRSAISGPAASKTSGLAKTTKKDIGPKKSVNSQDYRYAPLTIPNVDLFNKMQGSLFSF
jgi:hypothetical protein